MKVTYKLSVIFLELWVVMAIRRTDMFPYGARKGDLFLEKGDDKISKINLVDPMYFYESQFSRLYVSTNGVISTMIPPLEGQYVDSAFPTEYSAIAPFLADLDNSRGNGFVWYRLEDTTSILKRVTKEVQKAFPEACFTPTHTVVATWENMPAYEEMSHNATSGMVCDTSTSTQCAIDVVVNTFQVVLAYNDTASYALFLYPEDGVQFFGTRSKKLYSSGVELPARVGFSRGGVLSVTMSLREGPYYQLTSTEQSIKDLYQEGNTGIPGVWLFFIGSGLSFRNVVPAVVVGRVPVTTPLDWDTESSIPEYSGADYTDEPFHSAVDYDYSTPLVTTRAPSEDLRMKPSTSNRSVEALKVNSSQHGEDLNLGLPPHSGSSPLLTFNVDEDLESGSGVFHYETQVEDLCVLPQPQCSQHSYCMEYVTGVCCHCRSGFYGNGRQCLPDGVPQRINGKVNGRVFVGNTPVKLAGMDLHAYVVMEDGRAHTAIGHVPEPAGWALLPVAPIGALFSWLFALEHQGHNNGFSITGAEFTCHSEVTFFPDNQRLIIVQQAHGLDPHSCLNVDTLMYGRVPVLPPGAMVKMGPYVEEYHHYPSVVTLLSVREYTVLSAEGVSKTLSYQLRQNVTCHRCQHGSQVIPEVQQLRTELTLALYEEMERTLRFTISSMVGPAGEGRSTLVLANPCVTGTHNCHATAHCLPGQGRHFHCQCALGYRGNGHYCQDIDECAEGLGDCGVHAECVNAEGSHYCRCDSGFAFSVDSHTCVDIDECLSQLCHPHATCSNYLGSFRCKCDPGFEGDGFVCFPHHGGPRLRPGMTCEHWRAHLTGLEGRELTARQYVPQCDTLGRFSPVHCYRDGTSCWCVDAKGQEISGTRSHDNVRPPCIETVAPPIHQNLLSYPMMHHPTGPVILYTQGQQISIVPLKGSQMNKEMSSTLLSLQGSVVVGISYDCQDRMVYWTDVAQQTISRTRLEPGVQPEIVISTGLTMPEGLAVNTVRREMVWVDSGSLRIETSGLDGRGRRVLFHNGLVNPRAIVVDSIGGSLYWSDWNRDAPKIESSTVEGHDRRALVTGSIWLPIALTFDPSTRKLCWADAGTKKLECVAADGTRRQEIHRNLYYPFSLVVYAGNFYYTDWIRDGILAVSQNSSHFTDEYLPDQRCHLYGIAVASLTCSSGCAFCSFYAAHEGWADVGNIPLCIQPYPLIIQN